MTDPWMETPAMLKAAGNDSTERLRRIENAAARVAWEIHENRKMGVFTSHLWIEEHLKEALKP